MYKGVLDSGDGAVDVAVKTLKEGSAEEDRIKFLQEAAIMGQFKHHNVVTIYGVVTQGEPVSRSYSIILPQKRYRLHDIVDSVSLGVAAKRRSS